MSYQTTKDKKRGMLVHTSKIKKPVYKNNISYDPNHMKFWTRQKYREGLGQPMWDTQVERKGHLDNDETVLGTCNYPFHVDVGMPFPHWSNP